ncbi:LLM class flavin-dependent oxidoreductase [Acinetobacter boissieri]|uniref:FMN-dependent oxidoreductase, nitrilotriacetate monooxygenase family n=1 Tax=Acinetobacter boissieri TaxID=1219383 RepID=A0A1G6JQR7_9GAMM|nr:LLM class flavin-dependent oxidoreductase [Acinetobacter boissieri]SDC21102.1 FMN-dependent oxidoreductase, nitrilotriacetate monooxygenase family [Acinetobacter boissieri]
MSKKQMNLAMFLFPGFHFGAWRLPDAIPEIDLGIEHYVKSAQLAEEGKMDAIFFEDQAAVPRSNNILKGDTYGGASPRALHFDPSMLLPALARETTHLGLVATATTSFNEPYNIARRFSSLDFISNGRAGWNLVTSFNENEAQNFGLDVHMDHGDRYERAGEFFDVVSGLWEGWEKGALTRDKEKGVYFDVTKMNFLNHEGKYFKVRGPLTMDRSPQVRPAIFQAGSSIIGRTLAARTADAIFTHQPNYSACREFREDVRKRTAEFGRDPDKIKILPGIMPIVAETDEEAHALHEQMKALIPEDLAIGWMMQNSGGLDVRDYDLNGPLPEMPKTNAGTTMQKLMVEYASKGNKSILETARHFAESTGQPVIVGSPTTIADVMQEWFENEACDGFLVSPPYFPAGVENFVRLVIPELQRRGLFRTEYTGTHLREHLGVTSYT